MTTHTPYTISDWLGYLSHAEIDFLGGLADGLPANPKIVNIGAGGGTSAVTFLAARADCHLYTIEVQNESLPTGSLVGEKQAISDAGLYDEKRYTPIHGDSKSVGQNWLYGLVDMVFVDGDHSYEGARGDITIWLENLRDDGIIAIHDYQKVTSYRNLHPGEEITLKLLKRVIKPYPEVDRAVMDTLVGKYALIGVVETTIAFKKRGLDD
jgi:hypothetical protein